MKYILWNTQCQKNLRKHQKEIKIQNKQMITKVNTSRYEKRLRRKKSMSYEKVFVVHAGIEPASGFLAKLAYPFSLWTITACLYRAALPSIEGSLSIMKKKIVPLVQDSNLRGLRPAYIHEWSP